MLLVALLLASTGCATGSATQALLLESRPIVRHQEEFRRELAERQEARGTSIQRGGCPVCAW